MNQRVLEGIRYRIVFSFSDSSARDVSANELDRLEKLIPKQIPQ